MLVHNLCCFILYYCNAKYGTYLTVSRTVRNLFDGITYPFKHLMIYSLYDLFSVWFILSYYYYYFIIMNGSFIMFYLQSTKSFTSVFLPVINYFLPTFFLRVIRKLFLYLTDVFFILYYFVTPGKNRSSFYHLFFVREIITQFVYLTFLPLYHKIYFLYTRLFSRITRKI